MGPHRTLDKTWYWKLIYRLSNGHSHTNPGSTYRKCCLDTHGWGCEMFREGSAFSISRSHLPTRTRFLHQFPSLPAPSHWFLYAKEQYYYFLKSNYYFLKSNITTFYKCIFFSLKAKYNLRLDPKSYSLHQLAWFLPKVTHHPHHVPAVLQMPFCLWGISLSLYLPSDLVNRHLPALFIQDMKI